MRASGHGVHSDSQGGSSYRSASRGVKSAGGDKPHRRGRFGFASPARSLDQPLPLPGRAPAAANRSTPGCRLEDLLKESVDEAGNQHHLLLGQLDLEALQAGDVVFAGKVVIGHDEAQDHE